MRFRLLGRLELSRAGNEVGLPASRKVRALLGYLVLASRPVTRSQICELLWDAPNDPRGELRWCLSKIRGLIEEKARKRGGSAGPPTRQPARPPPPTAPRSASPSAIASSTPSKSRARRSTASRS